MLCREAREPIRTVASKPDTECEPQRMGNGRGNPACPYELFVVCSCVSRGGIPDMWPFKKDGTGTGKVAKDCTDDELRERYYAQLKDRKKQEKELEWCQVSLVVSTRQSILSKRK
jgi:hypothetical protein